MIGAIETAIYNKLSGVLLGGGVSVYETVAPQDRASYPYVVMTPVSLVDNSTDGETEAFTGSFDVHVWSDQHSNSGVADIQKQIYDSLHLAGDLNPTGYTVSIVRLTNSQILLDPDGITRHGVQSFDIMFEVPTTYSY